MAVFKYWPQVFFITLVGGIECRRMGYLVRHPDGSWWCFEDQASAAGNPYSAGAVRLDPQLLEEIEDEAAERQVFLYRKILGPSQEETQMQR